MEKEELEKENEEFKKQIEELKLTIIENVELRRKDAEILNRKKNKVCYSIVDEIIKWFEEHPDNIIMNIDNLSDDSISRLKQKRFNNFFNLKFNSKFGFCSIYKSQTMQPFFINLQINKLFTESEARIERIARKMFVEMWNNSNNYIYKKGEKEFIGVIISKNHFDDICNSYYIKEEEKRDYCQ
jgi:hypothetical protein